MAGACALLEYVDANLCGGEDFLDRHGNLGANTVTLDQADQVVALQTALSALRFVVSV
jgi:hypothetical protein